MKRLREAEDRFESVEASNNKGEGMLRKIGVGKPCIDGHGYDKVTFRPVGVRFLKRVEPGLLADPWVVGWKRRVEKMVGAVESVKVSQSGLVMFVCVSSDQTPCDVTWAMTCVLLCS